MRTTQDIVSIVIAAQTLGRVAAISTRNETPVAQWRTLSILRNEGPQRLGELARLSRITQPGMTRLIGSMIETGLVERTEDPTDSRATVISATSAGQESLAQWREQLHDALLPLFDDLSDDDWNVLTRASEILTSRTTQLQEHNR